MNNYFKVPRNHPLQPTRQINAPKKAGTTQVPRQESDFSQILQQRIETTTPLKFSAHAQKRLAMSGIQLSDNQISQLEEAVSKVAEKGGRESLVVMDDLAFVVSVRNKTVITAIDSDRLKENIFTNIDSAVIT